MITRYIRSTQISLACPEYQGQSDDQHHTEHPHPTHVPPFHAISVHGDLLRNCCLRMRDTVRLISSDRPPSLYLSSSSPRFSCACPLDPASWPCGRSSSACDPS